MPDLEAQEVLCFPSYLHQSHVIFQEIVKFVTDYFSEGFPMAIKQTILDIPSSFHLRNYLGI